MHAPQKVNKILLIRFSSIGDIVLTTPLIRCLKKTYPNAELHLITKKPFAGILEGNPYLSKIFTIEKNVGECIDELKKEKYDYLIDLHKNLRSMQVKKALPGKAFTFPKYNIQKWIYVQTKWDVLPNTHIVDRYFESLRPLGVSNDNQGLDFFISPEGKAEAASFLSALPSAFIAFAIGAKFATKALPAMQIAHICKSLPLPVVLLGGKEDSAKASEITALCPTRVFDACGKLSLHGSAGIVEKAALLITHDTGLMHIGAALQKKMLSIWGSTVPRFGMYPYMPQHPGRFSLHEVGGLSCRPCSKLGFATCPKKHFNCMLNQDIEAIRTEAESKLKE